MQGFKCQVPVRKSTYAFANLLPMCPDAGPAIVAVFLSCYRWCRRVPTLKAWACSRPAVQQAGATAPAGVQCCRW